jgi:parallel beta-helix repeat protein
LLVVLLSSWASWSSAAGYYVSQQGSDSNSGESWQAAWKTPSRAAQSAGPGDVVVIRAGPEPYEELTVQNSGTSEQPLEFQGEDPNDPPVFSGGLIERGWVQSDQPGVWRVRTSADPALLLEDGRALAPASSTALQPGSWFWSRDELYYMPTKGAPSMHEVWRATRAGQIMIQNKSWIVIENVQCFVGQGACVNIRNGQHNIVRNLTARFYWRGINIMDGSSDNLIEDCLVSGNHDGIYILGSSSRNTVQRCKAINNGNLPAWTQSDRTGIAVGGSGLNVGNIIEDCESAGNGGPRSDPGLIAYAAPGTILRRNNVHDNYGSGVFVTIGSNGSLAEDNTVSMNGAQAVAGGDTNIAGLSDRRSKGVTFKGNVVMNNHVAANSPWARDGPRGGIEVRGISTDDMSGTLLIDNCVEGTIGGPDFYVQSGPILSGLQVTWAPCAVVPMPPNNMRATN